jgi:hypothetical protein
MAQERWRGFQSPWYTTGHGADPEVVRRLSDEFPGVFRLIASAVTFDEGLRRRLVPRAPEASRLRDLLLACRAPQIFLLHVGVHRTLEDLSVVDRTRPVGAAVTVASLHCTRWHGDDVKTLARRGQAGLSQVASRVLADRGRFSALAPEAISFHGPAEALALKHEVEIKGLFEPYEVTRADVALCSVAAEPMIRRALGGRGRVVAVRDSLGGTTTCATTVTTANVT